MCSYPSCMLCSLSSPADPNMAFDMMKGMFTNMLPMIVIGGWINWTFSGFITSELPWQHNHLFDFSLLPHTCTSLVTVTYASLPPSLLVHPHMYICVLTTSFCFSLPPYHVLSSCPLPPSYVSTQLKFPSP